MLRMQRLHQEVNALSIVEGFCTTRTQSPILDPGGRCGGNAGRCVCANGALLTQERENITDWEWPHKFHWLFIKVIKNSISLPHCSCYGKWSVRMKTWAALQCICIARPHSGLEVAGGIPAVNVIMSLMRSAKIILTQKIMIMNFSFDPQTIEKVTLCFQEFIGKVGIMSAEYHFEYWFTSDTR